jgi:hypothetical protein
MAKLDPTRSNSAMISVVASMTLLVGLIATAIVTDWIPAPPVSEFLTLTDDDDGKLFRVRVLNTGEERIARYHCFSLAGRPLKFRALPTRTIRTIIDAGCMRAGVRRLWAGFAMIRLDLTGHYRSSAMPH